MNFYKRIIFHFFLFIIVFFAIQIIIKQFFVSENLLCEYLSEDFSETSITEKLKL